MRRRRSNNQDGAHGMGSLCRRIGECDRGLKAHVRDGLRGAKGIQSRQQLTLFLGVAMPLMIGVLEVGQSPRPRGRLRTTIPVVLLFRRLLLSSFLRRFEDVLTAQEIDAAPDRVLLCGDVIGHIANRGCDLVERVLSIAQDEHRVLPRFENGDAIGLRIENRQHSPSSAHLLRDNQAEAGLGVVDLHLASTPTIGPSACGMHASTGRPPAK